MPSKAKNHADWSLSICGTCARKEKDLRKINPELLSLIRTYQYEEYDFLWCPKVICKGCINSIKDMDKLGDNSTRWIPTLDYSAMARPKPATRSTDASPCSCYWCGVARLNGQQYLNHAAEIRNKPGRTLVKKDTFVENAGKITVCQSCQGRIGPGLPHNCNKTSRQDNLMELIKQTSVGTQEKVASRLIDNICQDKNVSSSSGTLELSTRGSFKKTINIGTIRPPKMFTTEDLIQLQSTLNLRNKNLYELRTALRTVLGFNSVQPGLRDAVREVSTILKPFFELREVEMVRKIRGKDETIIEKRWGVFVKDVEAFVAVILDVREIDAENHEILLGADDGQEILKVNFIWFSLQ